MLGTLHNHLIYPIIFQEEFPSGIGCAYELIKKLHLLAFVNICTPIFYFFENFYIFLRFRQNLYGNVNGFWSKSHLFSYHCQQKLLFKI